MSVVGSPAVDCQIERFVLELLCTGSVLSELVSELSAALPADTYPGEQSQAVIIEMLCGTIGTALASAKPSDLERSQKLIELAGERTLEHLRLARDLSRRMNDDGGRGRTYG